jgi:hypothetical protein
MCCECIWYQLTLQTHHDESTMQRTQMPPLDEISLNCSEDCDRCNDPNDFDGCDGRSVEFYGYTRLRQPNDMSTGYVQNQYETQFGRSLGQHRVHTLGGARVNTLGSVRVNIGMYLKRFQNRTTGGKAKQIDIQYGIWIVYNK